MADLFTPFPVEYEPKRKNRFLVTIEDEHVDIMPWVMHKAEIPVYSFETSSWEDITIEINDPIGPSTSQIVYEQIVLKHKNCGINEYGLKFDMLDPVGVTVESWRVLGRFINADFGELDYSSDDISTVKLKFKVSRCFMVVKRDLILEKLGVRFKK